mmetsp:Transcript_51954/g.137437  ORF Transcript_51954/g.137437 Transcript_51954/m.137437 type:complete len:247 (-) Transcript_51954:2140-2880(-)
MKRFLEPVPLQTRADARRPSRRILGVVRAGTPGADARSTRLRIRIHDKTGLVGRLWHTGTALGRFHGDPRGVRRGGAVCVCCAGLCRQGASRRVVLAGRRRLLWRRLSYRFFGGHSSCRQGGAPRFLRCRRLFFSLLCRRCYLARRPRRPHRPLSLSPLLTQPRLLHPNQLPHVRARAQHHHRLLCGEKHIWGLINEQIHQPVDHHRVPDRRDYSETLCCLLSNLGTAVCETPKDRAHGLVATAVG